MTRNYCATHDELYTFLQAHFRNISIDRPVQRPQNQKQGSDTPSAGVAAYQIGKLDDIERLVSALRVKDAKIRQMAINSKESERKLAESWRRWLNWTLEPDKVISDLERTIRNLKQQIADQDNCIQQLQEQFAMTATENSGRADRIVLNMRGSLTVQE
jgi:predicted RNase H-like nuclease (RuvC/YqgF family)